MNEICVIGGSRDFGLGLVENLRDHGARVTVVNRGSSAPPRRVTHLRTGRGDEEGMRLAPAGRTFDAVVDQVCYTPRHAAVARRVFEGRTPGCRLQPCEPCEARTPVFASCPEGTWEVHGEEASEAVHRDGGRVGGCPQIGHEPSGAGSAAQP
ncbi:hypothetical protein AB0K48_07420 [Nonomuraea sp. NPDC055795]